MQPLGRQAEEVLEGRARARVGLCGEAQGAAVGGEVPTEGFQPLVVGLMSAAAAIAIAAVVAAVVGGGVGETEVTVAVCGWCLPCQIVNDSGGRRRRRRRRRWLH